MYTIYNISIDTHVYHIESVHTYMYIDIMSYIHHSLTLISPRLRSLQQEVLRFHVPVHNAQRMAVGQCAEHLLRKGPCQGLRQALLALRDEAEEVAARAVLHEQEDGLKDLGEVTKRAWETWKTGRFQPFSAVFVHISWIFSHFHLFSVMFSVFLGVEVDRSSQISRPPRHLHSPHRGARHSGGPACAGSGADIFHYSICNTVVLQIYVNICILYIYAYIYTFRL